MFRFEDNLPKCYLNDSRDFQLMTRLDDSLFMGQRSDIATITNLNSSNKCKNTFLHLLAEKVGFFTKVYIDDDVLRAIIGAFQTCIKYKGTKKGIELAVTAILKCENTKVKPLIDIVSDSNATKNKHHLVRIYLPVKLQNTAALKEFLKYILPFGYYFEVITYTALPENAGKTALNSSHAVSTKKVNEQDAATIRDTTPINDDEFADNLLGSFDLGMISDIPDNS